MFVEHLLVQHSYKLSLSGHGPGHVVMCIAVGLLATATGPFLACITRNLSEVLVSVLWLGTAHECSGWQFELNCLRHGSRKLLLTEIFNRQNPRSQSISYVNIVLVFDYLLCPTGKKRNSTACWGFM